MHPRSPLTMADYLVVVMRDRAIMGTKHNSPDVKPFEILAGRLAKLILSNIF